MTRRKAVTAFLVVVFVCLGCAGNRGAESRTPHSKRTASRAPSTTPSTGHFCAEPITEPTAVWQRIEAVRRLSNDELLGQCGLDFVLTISQWRTPPIDLLRRIVAHESKDFNALEEWVRTYATTDARAVEAVVAMDILSDFEIGQNPAQINRKRTRWQPLASEIDQVEYIVNEALALSPLLANVKEIHHKRCMLEVNPLGFAVSCTPIHPARQKIDLRWREEVRDGLLINLELSRCNGSASCKELKKASREFLRLYLKTVDAMESLQADVFKQQLREWLQVPPFSRGVA